MTISSWFLIDANCESLFKNSSPFLLVWFSEESLVASIPVEQLLSEIRYIVQDFLKSVPCN